MSIVEIERKKKRERREGKGVQQAGRRSEWRKTTSGCWRLYMFFLIEWPSRRGTCNGSIGYSGAGLRVSRVWCMAMMRSDSSLDGTREQGKGMGVRIWHRETHKDRIVHLLLLLCEVCGWLSSRRVMSERRGDMREKRHKQEGYGKRERVSETLLGVGAAGIDGTIQWLYLERKNKTRRAESSVIQIQFGWLSPEFPSLERKWHWQWWCLNPWI